MPTEFVVEGAGTVSLGASTVVARTIIVTTEGAALTLGSASTIVRPFWTRELPIAADWAEEAGVE